MQRPLLFYLLVLMLSVLSQFAYLILTLKYLLGNLFDYLLIIYLCLLIISVVLSIMIFLFLCCSPLDYLKRNSYEKLNSYQQTKSFETFSK